MNANPTESQELLYFAAQVAEYAGEWNVAVSFYRKLLKKKNVNAGAAAIAIPRAYRLLINHLEDTDAAYLFMREDGGVLRAFGRARQFEEWFFTEADRRKDVLAMAQRLTLIYNSNHPSDAPELQSRYLKTLLRYVESYNHKSENLIKTLEKLANAKKSSGYGKGKVKLGNCNHSGHSCDDPEL